MLAAAIGAHLVVMVLLLKLLLEVMLCEQLVVQAACSRHMLLFAPEAGCCPALLPCTLTLHLPPSPHTFLQAVNTNITLPLTHWQLEVRVRWVKAAPIIPTNINELFEAHPLKTKLYAVGLLCSPRWALLWAWLFDRDPGLRLLQLHIAQHQVQFSHSHKSCC